MKFAIVLCVGLCLSVYAHAQTARVDTINKTITFDLPVKLKVNLNEERMTIVYNNQEIPGATPQVLDSLMKKIPDFKNIKVEFEGLNANPEKKKAIDAVLKQCQCRISGHMIKINHN